MTDPIPGKSERDVLPEPVATRVLARAIELDQVRNSGTSVADLRAVAGEVGVSAGAFNAALAELDHGKNAPVPNVPAKTSMRFRIVAFSAGILALIAVALMTVVVPRRDVPVSVAPMEEEAFVLRCLSPDEAADLIRPLLHFSEHSMVRAKQGSRVITVRATAEELKQVQSLLDQKQSADSPACAARPSPTVAR